MAAVLACGPGAVLSHTSAALLWGMIRPSRPSSSAGVQLSIPHITVPGEAKSRKGIRVHRSQTLFPDAVTRRHGIPVTTPARTLTDLRRLLPQPQFAAALRQAEYLGLPIGDGLDPDHTRSELEARFLRFLRRHRLPQPRVNEAIGPYVVDFLWPARRLIVELDGYRAHAGPAAFEADRTRDANLTALGFDVIRCTWRQLHSEPMPLAAMLRSLLAQ